MTEIIASVAAGKAVVQGVLAAEALRKAAKLQGRSIEVEVHTAEGVLNKLSAAQMQQAGLVLLVGEGAVLPEATAPRVTASIEQVLADPAALLGGPKQAVKRIVAVTSCPTGIAHTFMAAEGLLQAAAALGLSLIHISEPTRPY